MCRIENPTSFIETGFNNIKRNFETGISLPDTFCLHFGWAVSLSQIRHPNNQWLSVTLPLFFVLKIWTASPMKRSTLFWYLFPTSQTIRNQLPGSGQYLRLMQGSPWGVYSLELLFPVVVVAFPLQFFLCFCYWALIDKWFVFKHSNRELDKLII